ncbi:MAG: hypothetical protein KAT70_09655 [Thermoplasmata archaeon]|nr:hypothetical protein [Thermoplasmata archaeon]
MVKYFMKDGEIHVFPVSAVRCKIEYDGEALHFYMPDGEKCGRCFG